MAAILRWELCVSRRPWGVAGGEHGLGDDLPARSLFNCQRLFVF